MQVDGLLNLPSLETRLQFTITNGGEVRRRVSSLLNPKKKKNPSRGGRAKSPPKRQKPTRWSSTKNL